MISLQTVDIEQGARAYVLRGQTEKGSEDMTTDGYPSRSEARQTGSKFYRGSSCEHGHSGIRYLANGACRECVRVYDHGYKTSRREQERDRKRAWRKANAETHRLRQLIEDCLRGHRTAFNEEGAPRSVLFDILQDQGGHCAYCSSPDRLTIDHKQPVTRGGTNDPANLHWLCSYHNQAKGRMTDAEYRAKGVDGLPTETPPYERLLRKIVR